MDEQLNTTPTQNINQQVGAGNVAVVSVEQARRKKFAPLVVRSFRDAVKKHIWDETKFCTDSQLEFDGEFARKILHYLDMGTCEEETKRNYWREHKSLVQRSLRTMRNGAVQAVKESMRNVHDGKSLRYADPVSDGFIQPLFL